MNKELKQVPQRHAAVEPDERGEKQDSIKFRELPIVSVLGPKSMTRATALLQELEEHEFITLRNGKQIARKDRVEELKKELQELQENFELQGFRYGGLCFAARECEGRATLKKDLLLEAGVSARVIQECTKKGAGFVQRYFKKIEI